MATGILLPEIQGNRAARAISGFSGFVPGQQDALGVSQVAVLKSAAHKRVVPVMYPRSVAGSFLSAVSTDGAIYDHRFETTSRQASRDVERLAASRGPDPLPGAGDAVRATTGYTGHIHQHIDVIGKSFHHALALGDARLEAATIANGGNAVDCEPHWTEFHSRRNDPQVTASGGWRSMYGLYLARRASPESFAAAVRAAEDGQPPSPAATSHKQEQHKQLFAGQSTLPGLDSYDTALIRSAKSLGLENESLRHSSVGVVPSISSTQRGAVMAPEDLWVKPPPPPASATPVGDEADLGGPLSGFKARGVSGYTGHVPHAIDTLGRTYTRVAAALEQAKGDFASQEPPHPLGKSFMR